jgi:metal-responsive CopG/Arc/MetJ family transcriptional regulator
MTMATTKRRGRPATGMDPVTAIRLSGELRAAIDNWRRKQADIPARSEAIRRLVQIGLKSKRNA